MECASLLLLHVALYHLLFYLLSFLIFAVWRSAELLIVGRVFCAFSVTGRESLKWPPVSFRDLTVFSSECHLVEALGGKLHRYSVFELASFRCAPVVAFSIDSQGPDHARASRITMLSIFGRYEISGRLVGHFHLVALVLEDEGLGTARARVR